MVPAASLFIYYAGRISFKSEQGAYMQNSQTNSKLQ